MEKFFSRRHLHVAKLIFHASYGLGFVASLLPRQNVKASVPVIFADKVVEFRIIVIAIVFTFITALSAIVIGDNSAVARSCTLCSVITMFLVLLVLSYVFLPNFFRCYPPENPWKEPYWRSKGYR